MEAPTIAQLAPFVGPEGWRPSWSSLVPMQTEGSRIPIFFSHGMGGNVLHLHTLSRHLGTDQPFYGLQAQGLDGEAEPYETAAEMAAHYIQEIRRVHPVGPYILGGFSYGGVVAFELAQQLVAQGEEVAALLLVDSYFPGKPTYMPERTPFQAFVYPRVAAIESNVEAWQRVGTAKYLRDWVIWGRGIVKRRIARVAKRLSSRVTLEGWDAPEGLKKVIAANRRAERDYVPKMYPGPIMLCWCHEPFILEWDTRLAWEEVARDGLEVHVVSGNHNSVREEPHVTVLTGKISAYLNRRLSSGLCR